MKRVLPALVAGSLIGLSPSAFGAAEHDKPAARPQATTHTGVMRSVSVNNAGEITEIYIKISDSVATERVDGCGAKSADHPLLNWAFQNGRVVHINVDGGNCFGGVIVSAP